MANTVSITKCDNDWVSLWRIEENRTFSINV